MSGRSPWRDASEASLFSLNAFVVLRLGPYSGESPTKVGAIITLS